jgi:WD40 repeat protein
MILLFKLAGGFERIRNEHSILIWDVRGNTNTPTTKIDLKTESVIYSTAFPSQSEQQAGIGRPFYNLPNTLSNITMSMNLGSTSNSNTASNGNGDSRKLDPIKPTYETGTSESCHSLTWNPHNMNQLLAGINGKSLKIFDIKGKSSYSFDLVNKSRLYSFCFLDKIKANSKANSSVNTKYVYGFSIDPAPSASQHQAASFLDNIIAIWDTRMFDRPIHLITENEPIYKIQWCPTK